MYIFDKSNFLYIPPRVFSVGYRANEASSTR